MDKIIEEFNDNYISIEYFILYLAFKLEEPIETVVSWLLYNSFDKCVNSYDIDKHYRVYISKNKNGVDLNIDKLFEQISIDGYFSYAIYLSDYEYQEVQKKIENSLYDTYEVVSHNFYLKLEDLREIKFLANLNFSDAKKYHYYIYQCDSVTAKLHLDNDAVATKTRSFIYSDLDRSKFSKTTSAKEDHRVEIPDLITEERLMRLFNLIASENLPNENDDSNPKDQDKTYDKPTNNRSQDKKLIAILALLLANKSKKYKIGDKRPNATQISNAIYEFAKNELKIADEDMTGLKANIDKISRAIQEYSDILYKRPDD